MRMIQTKLHTPTNSVEKLHNHQQVEHTPVPPSVTPVQPPEERNIVQNNQYRPPAINLSTWSERPKTQISLKEDTDYKINNSRVLVNTINNTGTKSSIEIVNHNTPHQNYNGNDVISIRTQSDSNNVSIKVNSSEPILSQKSGNVIIKIGTNTGNVYRKPLGNINGMEHKTRPHSIAIDNTFDVSRVPIVRAVELKKPYKDSPINKSVTQIYASGVEETDSIYRPKYSTSNEHTHNNFSGFKQAPDKVSEHRKSSETLNGNGPRLNAKNSNFYVGNDIKPVIRVNSFAANPVPVVRGFRSNDSNNNSSNFRKSWNVTTSNSSMLPSKINANTNKETEELLTTNKNVPFSQSCLRRTDSSKISTNTSSSYGFVVPRNTHNGIANNNYRNSVGSFPTTDKLQGNGFVTEKIQPPQPPEMPKASIPVKSKSKPIASVGDSRNELLSAIRNFGGKKGLKAAKV